MEKIQHEERKVPGVCYALTSQGVELPVIDVTHPAFALELSAIEQQELVKKFLAQKVPLANWPAPLRKLFFRLALRGSLLAAGLRNAEGGYMTGMHTYLLKLGPEMLGSAYTSPVDRKIAASLPALGTRLRVREMAQLMAETLTRALSAIRKAAVICGYRRRSRDQQLERADRAAKGKAGPFGRASHRDRCSRSGRRRAGIGKAALVALSEEGGPLDGVGIGFRHIHYDWAKTEGLEPVLREAQSKGALVICSSEGGLFEYGADQEIVVNLKALRACPQVLAVVVW